MDLKESAALGDGAAAHWYYRAKARAMLRMLGGVSATTVLDVGAGSGFFARHLLATTPVERAWCVDTGYADDRDETAAGKTLHFRRTIDQSDATLVLLMDVLEHVDDDCGLLTAYRDQVPRGAKFLLSVPAFQWLWSDHDRFLEHRRRYRLTQLEAVAQCAGLRVEAGAYYFGMVFPLAATIRLAARLRPDTRPARSQLSTHPAWVNGTLSALCDLELPLMRFNRVAGLTAFCLATKP